MIIKKSNAAATKPAPVLQDALPVPVSHQETLPAIVPAPVSANNPYDGIDAPEDIQARGLPERRRTDRRTGFRRQEEQDCVSTAQAEANAIREAAHQAGFQSGLDTAQNVIEDLRVAIDDLHQARNRAYHSAGEDLSSLAVDIAKHIIKTEVSCDPDLVMSMVHHTLQQVSREQKHILLRVNPLDVKTVKHHVKIDDDIPSGVEIQVREDADVDAGSCTVETRAGFIDAKFSTQLDVLKRLLLMGGKA